MRSNNRCFSADAVPGVRMTSRLALVPVKAFLQGQGSEVCINAVSCASPKALPVATCSQICDRPVRCRRRSRCRAQEITEG